MLPAEVIVVDDASSDGTPDLIEAMIETSPVPLRLIRLVTNSGGPAHPTNVGIAAASGELIAVLDQDDVFAPTKLEDQASVLIEAPSIVFAFSFCDVYGREGDTRQSPSLREDILAEAESKPNYFCLSGKRVLFLLMKHGCFVLGFPGFVFRRRDWTERGGLDETLRIASDYDFLCDLSTRGPVAFVPRTAYSRREHGANLSGDLRQTSVEFGTVLLRYFLSEKAAVLRHGRRRELRETLLGVGYWFRKVRRYRDALRVYALAARHTGLDLATVRDVCKLLLEWAWPRESQPTRLGRRA
jgi:glycosyltransferase involved in cell wall biosynthesis